MVSAETKLLKIMVLPSFLECYSSAPIFDDSISIYGFGGAVVKVSPAKFLVWSAFTISPIKNNVNNLFKLINNNFKNMQITVWMFWIIIVWKTILYDKFYTIWKIGVPLQTGPFKPNNTNTDNGLVKLINWTN